MTTDRRFSGHGALALPALIALALLLTMAGPAANAAKRHPALDSAGRWHLPGPGVVLNETNKPGQDIYIIRHQAPSLARYKGDIPGLAATSAKATGKARLDVKSAASQAYLAYLADRHAELKQAIDTRLGRSVDVVHRYDAVLNGIAVRMTAAEAASIADLPGVRRVERDATRELQTDNGPRWINADVAWGTEGVEFPNCDGPSACGEGITVGVIDTGINFDHPSFADVGADGYDHTSPIPVFRGVCSGQPANLGIPGLCNDKLIGIYDFTQTTPEDGLGHGSHTASTAAGNFVSPATLEGPTITLQRNVSGVAPHANVISYKACQEITGNCLLSGILAAINALTLDADVVDVANYSIGGSSSNPWTDSDAQAFFDSYEAGIFVATSASNTGPGFGTIGSPADAPWLTTVGASTHDREIANGAVDMTSDGGPLADTFGAGITDGYPSANYPYQPNPGDTVAPIVWAGDYQAQFQGSDPSQARLCGAGVGDPATGEGSEDPPWPPGTFNGEIVLCERGEFGRVHKGQNVLDAGAGGYILMNDAANGNSLVADAHVLPGVHISHDDGNALKAWLAANTNTVGRISGMIPGESPANGDIMAGFSARGANPAAANVIKPDVTAPGVDILAAYHTPAGTVPGGTPEFNIISGTSMSSPHTAGAAALLRAAHPTWTVDEVKSALMSTAFTVPTGGKETHPVYKEDGATPADPFDMGGGRVDMATSVVAGFVLDETPANHQAADPGAGGDVRTLNLASMADDECGAFNVQETCSWTRTIRSTLTQPVEWTVSGSGPAGMVLTASPNVFTLAGGATQQITFTADVSGVTPKNQWTFAEVTFTPDDTSVPDAHFPVAVVPKDFGGGVAGTVLPFHGNLHDDCVNGPNGTYQGNGEADVISGCVPFLSEDPVDPTNPAATWGPLQPGLNGTAVDPHWVWTLTEETRLAGPMTVSWWASQGSSQPVFDTNFTITLVVDGVQILEQQVAHFMALPGVPQRLTNTLPVPDVTATSTIEIGIDVNFIDTGNSVTFYYDSEQPCNPATGPAVPCDSHVSLPVIQGPLPPIASDDAAFLINGGMVTIDVLANDFDPEGGPLSVEIVSGPTNGTAEVTLSNAIKYTHDGSATTTDLLLYRVTDVDGLTDTATVGITISDSCVVPASDFFDDFESGAGDWLVDTAVIFPPSNSWQLTDLQPAAQSGSFLWYTDADAQDPVNTSDTTKDVRLVSPPQDVSGSSQLTFWHRYSTEQDFDGGVLEISTDGGSSWQDIVAAGGTFVQGGYTGTFPSGSGFALAGRNAWTGLSPAYPTSMEQVIVDLSFFAGKTVQVRFRFGQDELATQPAGGWWIDDVRFTNLLEDCPDGDSDGVPDPLDNCPATPNGDQADGDGDTVGDACDNCTQVANADQCDTNGDGYGNACDGDLNNNNVVNFVDLGILKAAIFSGPSDPNWNPDADLSCDGNVVNFVDLGILKSQFFGAPGPSAFAP